MRSHTHGSRNSFFVLSIHLAISYRSIYNNGGSLVVACMCVVVVVVVKTIEYLYCSLFSSNSYFDDVLCTFVAAC